jgi:hypothetical protein
MFEQLLEILAQCDENPGVSFPLSSELFRYARFDNKEIFRCLGAVVWDEDQNMKIAELIIAIEGEDDHEKNDEEEDEEDIEKLYAVFSKLPPLPDVTDATSICSVMRIMTKIGDCVAPLLDKQEFSDYTG